MSVISACIALFLLAILNCRAQSDLAKEIVSRIEKETCATLQSGTKVCKYDYKDNGKAVEAISFRPAGDGLFPGVVMIPGFGGTARDLVPLGVRMANSGFAAISVSQLGFGTSDGPPDFVGPKTINAIVTGYRKLQKEAYVDPKRMGIYGYSRGGMAASLLAVELDDLKAAVLGAGIYDLRKFYDDTPLPGARKNVIAETGLNPEAIRVRSSILQMEKLKCPVLIMHGGKDERVPVNQAYMLRDRLTKLNKDFEFKIFPESGHSIGQPAGDLAIDFLKRKLQ